MRGHEAAGDHPVFGIVGQTEEAIGGEQTVFPDP
ncbi:hypothetical protein OPIT5_13390 [Opitutaceae bacterium TAV5]|nr:hypothetical protein OPIT5_13390 [Opitutaceae bacterium TAV5]